MIKNLIDQLCLVDKVGLLLACVAPNGVKIFVSIAFCRDMRLFVNVLKHLILMHFFRSVRLLQMSLSSFFLLRIPGITS